MRLRALFFLAFVCLLSISGLSQHSTSVAMKCGITETISKASLAADYQKRLSKYKSHVSNIVEKQLKNNSTATVPCPNGITIIPIAFHLFHEPNAQIGEEHNFSLHDLNLVVDYLNMHFSGVNPRKEMLGEDFINFDAGNTCIQFTIGKINRIATDNCEHWKKNVTQYQLHKCLPGGSGVGSENDPNDFLNIYVTELFGGLLGQASNIPGVLGRSNADSDGVTVSRNIIIPGDQNKTLYNAGGILTHEIGHWLGLAHVDGDIQGSGCEGDDGLADTYPQESKNTYVCSEALPRSCGTPDNVYNFMDYSMDCAKLMFTKQQALIMNDVLVNDRKELTTSYRRMPKEKPLYSLQPTEHHSTPIEWIKVNCQEQINLLEYQRKWTKRNESQQSFTGTYNYYWERDVTATLDEKTKIIDDRYLSRHNVLSGLGNLKETSILIYKLKEQSWSSSLKKYEPARTRGIILIRVNQCPSPTNDKIENAISLNQGTLCGEETYSLLFANTESHKNASNAMSDSKDVWFKMQTSSKKEGIDLIIKRPNSGQENPVLEAFNSDMQPLAVTLNQSFTETYYTIQKNEGESVIYIRAFDTDKPIADPFQICRMSNDDLNDHCDIAYEVVVQKSCQWLGYSFNGSTASTDVEANYNCGANKEYYDVWFETTAPRSGYFTVKCRNKAGVKNDLLLEVYSGTCENKKLIGCQMVYGISAVNPVAYLPIVGLKAQEKVFIRVGGKGYGQQGDFELCVSRSFENICTITKIEVGETMNCNDVDYTYAQELTVSYQSTGALNKLIVNGQYFTLIDNPQKIILREVPSNKPLTIKANLLNLEDPSCWTNSTYSVEDIHSNASPCNNENKSKDDCSDIEMLDVTDDCKDVSYSFTKYGRSGYSADGGCLKDHKDKWFEIVAPAEGKVVIELSGHTGDGQFVVEAYEGICNERELITCSFMNSKESDELSLSKLTPGSIIYIRVGVIEDNYNGKFTMCVRETLVAEFRDLDKKNNNTFISEVVREEKLSITCFPNPTLDYINVSLEKSEGIEPTELSIFDNSGRLVVESQFTSQLETYDLSNLKSGVYLIVAQNGSDRVVRRVVKH